MKYGFTSPVNYPKQHSDNLTQKHQETGQWLKPTIRIFKNMRTRMWQIGIIGDGVAPSYYIEGLLYNVPEAALPRQLSKDGRELDPIRRNHGRYQTRLRELPALACPRRTTYLLVGKKLQFMRARAAQFLGYLQLIRQCFAFNTAYSLIAKALGPGARNQTYRAAFRSCVSSVGAEKSTSLRTFMYLAAQRLNKCMTSQAHGPISTRVNKPENDDPSIVDMMRDGMMDQRMMGPSHCLSTTAPPRQSSSRHQRSQ